MFISSFGYSNLFGWYLDTGASGDQNGFVSYEVELILLSSSYSLRLYSAALLRRWIKHSTISVPTATTAMVHTEAVMPINATSAKVDTKQLRWNRIAKVVVKAINVNIDNLLYYK